MMAETAEQNVEQQPTSTMSATSTPGDPNATNDDGPSTDYDELHPLVSLNYGQSAMIVVGLALVVVMIVTAFGNLLVGLALLRYKRLRTVSNCLIGNLALSDFLLAVTVLPLSTAHECLGRWIFGRVACKVWLIIDVLYCTASIWNLCVIAADRYTATMFPLWYRDRRSASRAVVYVAVVWVVAAATCVPPMIGWTTQENFAWDNATSTFQCFPFMTTGYVVYSASTSFFIPFLVTFVLYAQIFVILRRRMATMRSRRRSEVAPPPTSMSRTAVGATTTTAGSGRSTAGGSGAAAVSARSKRGSLAVGGGRSVSKYPATDTRDAESVCITEYSDEKSSIADAEPKVEKKSPKFVESCRSWTNRLAFSSFRRPAGRGADVDGASRLSRFRFTISGRHDSRALQALTSPVTPPPTAIGAIMTVSEMVAETPDIRSRSPEPEVDDDINSLRLAGDEDGTTRAAFSDVDENVDGEGKVEDWLAGASTSPAASPTDDFPVETTGGVFGGTDLDVVDCDSELLPRNRGRHVDAVHPSDGSVKDSGIYDGGVEVTVIGAPRAMNGHNGGSGRRRTTGEVRFAQLPGASETQETIASSVDCSPLPAVDQQKHHPPTSCNGTKAPSASTQTTTTTTMSTKSTATTASTSVSASRHRDRSERREMRATIRMAAIIGVFCAMWIGFFAVYVARGVVGDRVDQYVPHGLDAFLFWLGYANSTVNPILYAVFNVDFRRAFQRIIAGCCCWCSCCPASHRLLLGGRQQQGCRGRLR